MADSTGGPDWPVVADQRQRTTEGPSLLQTSRSPLCPESPAELFGISYSVPRSCPVRRLGYADMGDTGPTHRPHGSVQGDYL